MEGDIEARFRERYTLIDRTDPEQIRDAQARGINITDDGTLVGEPDGSGFGVPAGHNTVKAADIASISQPKKPVNKKKGKERQR